MGAGSSVLADPAAAGRQAAESAMRALTAGADAGPARPAGIEPALVLVYATARHDLPVLLAAIRRVTGDAPLVGASSSGQFTAGTLIPPGQGVSVLVLSSGLYRFGVASVTGLRAQAFESGRQLARATLAAAGPDRGRHSALLVFSDALAGDPQGLLNGVYQVTGAAVPVVGGAAAADRDLSETLVFHDDRVLGDGAVGVWIDSPRPLRVVSGHGWQSHGLPLLVTKVDGPVVHEIGGRPAREVYEENFRYADPMQELPTTWSQGYHSAHAFGLIEPDGRQLIRGAFIDEDGLIRTFTPLPPYSAVQIMSADCDDLLEVCESVVADALTDADARVMLTFSCAARMDILRERGAEEAVRLQEAAGSVPTFGFYTYGEFARTTGVSGYHNATLTALAL
ncbi:MAG TPA: FIST N-terminal domain-containing protein [Planosporangium sp.]|nr:FIST N-terminal domain-containing protein [Planosporangium sp.]